MAYSITQEALLASTKLSMDTVKSQAQTPENFAKFRNATVQKAILEREVDKENEGDDEDSLDGGLDGLENESEAGDAAQPGQGVEAPQEAGETSQEETDAADASEDGQGDDALADSIPEGTEQTSESVSEWIRDKTQGSDSSIVRGGGAVAAGLAHLGVTYGPAILNFMYKSTVWAFSRIGTGIQEGVKELGTIIELSKNSVGKLSARLDAAEKVIINSMNNGDNIPSFEVRDQKTIDFLRVDKDIDFTGNIRRYSQSLVESTKSIADEFESSITTLEKIASSDSSKRVEKLGKLMYVSPPRGGFRPGSLPGYKSDDQYVRPFHTYPLWPGSASLVFNAPEVNSDDIGAIKAAYGKADMYIGYARSKNVVGSVPSMSGAEAVMFIKTVRMLLAAMTEVSKSQNRMKEKAPSIGLIAKKLFYDMADDKAKEGLSNSMVEPLYLRSDLTASVFPRGTKSCSIHASKVAAAAVHLVELHAKKASGSPQ